MEITLESIGTIQTPFNTLENMPIQPYGAKDTSAILILKEAYKEGLKDLEGFSHIYLMYYFHKVKHSQLSVIPFNDTTHTPRGFFATRTPLHPNKIGLSKVRVTHVENNLVHIKGIDVLNGTPLLDIKPYIENFDIAYGQVKSGWMKASKEEIEYKRSDSRFIGA
jgi:tRNA-Thr(GGU) m(6)t(6)A37 methyltransferase TsaA